MPDYRLNGPKQANTSSMRKARDRRYRDRRNFVDRAVLKAKETSKLTDTSCKRQKKRCKSRRAANTSDRVSIGPLDDNDYRPLRRLIACVTL